MTIALWTFGTNDALTIGTNLYAAGSLQIPGIYILHAFFNQPLTENQVITVHVDEAISGSDTTRNVYSGTIFSAGAFETPPLVILGRADIYFTLSGDSAGTTITWRLLRVY